MTRLFAAIAALAIVTVAAVPAQAADVVKSKTKVVDAFDEEGDSIGIYAKLKTSSDCRSPKRKFILFEGNDKIDTANGYSDAFFLTSKVDLGDTVQVKAKSVRTNVDGEQVTCNGSTSAPFVLENLKPGRA